MRRIEMTPIKTSVGGVDLVVEGGWEAIVIEVAPKTEREIEPYVRHFQRSGRSPARARADVLSMTQELFEAAHLRRLRNSIRRWAREFYARYGSLEGFDPELLQNAFVPAQNFGRSGNDLAWRLMRDMRREIND